jgi:tape measure domain
MDGEVLVKFIGDTSDIDSKTKGITTSFGKMSGAMAIGNIAAKAVSKGIEVIGENVDRASQRIDTMNNYPKVMELFGVSADEASESIKRIDASVQGLPTSLDQAVSGVQDLFTVTNDLEQSESMFKAINDSAMVFANGSTEAVDRFIYGYKQALSAGKVSAQDFNQMNEAIPGLMSKVAESMGISYKELKDGLSDGSISIDQFNDALQN